MPARRRCFLAPLAFHLCLLESVLARTFLRHSGGQPLEAVQVTQACEDKNWPSFSCPYLVNEWEGGGSCLITHPKYGFTHDTEFGLLTTSELCCASCAKQARDRERELIFEDKALPAIRPWPYTKVLVFWCAKFEDRIVDLAIKNVEHLKDSRLNFDFFLAHYDMNRQLWLDRNRTWYEDNVRWGIDAPGFKVHLLKEIRRDRLAGDDFNILDYDWVWMLDEDVDITNARFHIFFQDAGDSNALVVGPAFYQKDPLKRDLMMDPYYPMNTPQWDKQFRYVPLVEIIMPLIRPQALASFFDCQTCMPPFNSDWGIDHIWCTMLERTFQVENHKTCAIVDHSGPVIHQNYGSTREQKSSKSVKSAGRMASRWLKKFHSHDYARGGLHRRHKWRGFGEQVFDYSRFYPVWPHDSKMSVADSSSAKKAATTSISFVSADLVADTATGGDAADSADVASSDDVASGDDVAEFNAEIDRFNAEEDAAFEKAVTSYKSRAAIG